MCVKSYDRIETQQHLFPSDWSCCHVVPGRGRKVGITNIQGFKHNFRVENDKYLTAIRMINKNNSRPHHKFEITFSCQSFTQFTYSPKTLISPVTKELLLSQIPASSGSSSNTTTTYLLVIDYGHRLVSDQEIESFHLSDLNHMIVQWPLLLTWFNFNPSMDK